MANADLDAYYQNLLILQYINQPKASATIAAIVDPVFIDQLPIGVQNAFGLDGSAQGVQLDILGKYVGVSRIGTDLLGNVITLDDSDYLQLLKIVIIQNNSGSSLATIEALLAVSFPQQILISDNRAMGLNYVIIESVGTSNLLALLATGHYLPKPMGVSISVTLVPSHTFPFFGVRTYAAADSTVAPVNFYAFINQNCPVFVYAD